jgi:hypothetical protein
MHLGFQIAPSAMPTQYTDFHGIDLTLSSSYPFDRSQTIRFYPFESSPGYSGTGHVAQLVGVYGYPNNNQSGTVGEALSYRALTENTGTGTVTLAEGIRLEGVLVPSGATPIPTYYGLHVLDLTDMAGVWGVGYQNPTLGFSLYCEGGQSFHRDPIGLGSGNNAGPYNGLLDLKPASTGRAIYVTPDAAQTADLLTISDASQNPVFRVIPSDGAAKVPALNIDWDEAGDLAANAVVAVRPTAGATGLHVRAAAAQTGELLQIHDNSDDPLLSVTASGQLMFGCAANEAAGSGSAGLGANCPAVTATAPYIWEKVTTSDGSQGYMPIWK